MVEQSNLFNLLVKLAFAASVASLLARLEAFKRLLLTEDRTVSQRLLLAFSLSAMFGGGVATRVITHGNYAGADMGLEGSLIAGLIGGYVPGLLAGVLISIPAMFGKELLSMPLFAAVGVLGGMMRDVAPEPEEIWNVTASFDVKIYRLIRNPSENRRSLFHLFVMLIILVAETLRFAGRQLFPPQAIFAPYPTQAGASAGHYAAIFVATLFAVVLPIKVWSNTRTERMLEMQQRLLQDARLRALTSQINPHFLFNTLNSIAALVRSNPETARGVIQKLSNILRRLLRKHENLSSLREEIAFIDDYLSIELVRFGDNLRFIKEVEPEALECRVPSMLLQPIVENSLKHGLSSKVDGGMIRLRIWRSDGRLNLIVEDDGVGIPEPDLEKLFTQGIGISNVNERLKVLFGGDYKMWIDSKAGEGTRTGIEIPDLTPGLAKAS